MKKKIANTLGISIKIRLSICTQVKFIVRLILRMVKNDVYVLLLKFSISLFTETPKKMR